MPIHNVIVNQRADGAFETLYLDSPINGPLCICVRDEGEYANVFYYILYKRVGDSLSPPQPGEGNVQRLPKTVVEDIYNLSQHYSNRERFGPDRPRPHGTAGHSSGWIPLLKNDETEFVTNFEELLKRYKIEYVFV